MHGPLCFHFRQDKPDFRSYSCWKNECPKGPEKCDRVTFQETRVFYDAPKKPDTQGNNNVPLSWLAGRESWRQNWWWVLSNANSLSILYMQEYQVLEEHVCHLPTANAVLLKVLEVGRGCCNFHCSAVSHTPCFTDVFLWVGKLLITDLFQSETWPKLHHEREQQGGTKKAD